MKTILAAIILISLSFLALGIRIFFRRNGKFPETEIGRNKKMRELNITCIKCDELRQWNEAKNKRKVKINPSKLKIDIRNSR
jgi:hypothetical protein